MLYKNALRKIASLLVFVGMLCCYLTKNHFILGNAIALFSCPIGLFSVFMIFIRRNHLDFFDKIHFFTLLGVMIYLFLPKFYNYQTSLPEQGKKVSLITANVFFKNSNKQLIVDELIEKDADIVALQEYTPEWEQYLKPTFEKSYTYFVKKPFSNTFGLALYSKYPIKSVDYLLNDRQLPIYQICQVQIETKLVFIIQAHISSPAEAVENPSEFLTLFYQNYIRRQQQVKQLEDYISKNLKNANIVLLGDLNTMKTEPLYRKMCLSWQDVFASSGSGWGFTFPNVSQKSTWLFPIITLDYIFIRGQIQAISSYVIRNSSSDHLPIWAQIEL